MIEWPPPGLEPIHRRIHRLTTRAWIATLLLCPLVLWLLFGAPGLDPQGGGDVLSLLALVGIATFLSAIAGVAGVIDQMRRARRLGYPADVILDVATDTNGDAAAWFGSAEQSNVRDVTRTRARSLRRSAALLNAFAAIAPPPLLALAMFLALRGAASLNAVLAIVLLPSLFALVTAAMLRGYALLLIQWDRGSAQWDPEPVTVQDRARDWIARTQQHAAPRPPATGQLTLVLFVALAGIAIFIFTALMTVGAIGGGVGTRGAAYALRNRTGGEQTLLVELARRERLPADSAIDPQTAGVQLHHVLFAGGRRSEGMHDVPRDVDREWNHPLTGPNRASARVWQRVLADSAAQEALADSEHPAVDIALRIARAPVADVFGGRWREDVPLQLNSIMRYELGNGSLLQHAIVARAARAARERRYDDAERDLRGLVSLGFLLMENSPAPSDQSRGSSMVRDGQSVLGRLRSLRGDSTTQLMLRTLDEAGVSQTLMTTYEGGSIGGLRRLAAGETGAYRARRWEAAMALSVIERCGSLRAVLFGPRENAAYLEQILHRALVRFPSEQRLFDVIHRPEDHRESLPTLPLPRRWAGTRVIEKFLGERHARSICYAAARM